MARSIKLFVLAGTQRFPFARLITALNHLVEGGLYMRDEILMQASVFPIEPLFTHYSYIPKEEYVRYLDEAEVVITHGGVNSIMAPMELGKPLVIVPRMKRYGEHIDDHQLEIAEMMEKRYGVTVVRDLKQLPEAIRRARTHQYKPWVSHTAELILFIKGFMVNG